MELARAEQLLELYFEGETSLSQEQELRDYFKNGNVAPHLEVYGGMFSAFAKAQQETLDTPVTLPKKRNYRWIASAAAVVVLSIGLFTQLNRSTASIQSTYDDPEVAVLKTKQALGMVSKILSESTAQLGAVQEFEKTPSKFFK